MSKNTKPTKYDTNVKHRLEEIKQWIEDGWTDEQIATELDLHTTTFYEYKKKYPKFEKASYRPNKWDTHVQPRLQEIHQWCAQGLTNDVICDKLGISEATWYEYVNQHPTLAELVKLGKSVMDSQVENSLLRAALGYEFEEVKTIIEEDKNGKKKTYLNAHHLDGWDWNKIDRYNVDNGITLCEICHKDFHLMYGYGENTKEQFEEYMFDILNFNIS